MENGKQSAFPITDVDNDHFKGQLQTGISKREYFAAMAMQGMCANTCYGDRHSNNREAISAKSIEIADAILKQLES